MKLFKILLPFLFLNVCSISAQADVVVIVHPSNAASLDKKSISRIFLGKLKKFPGGGVVVPLNLDSSLASNKEFNTKVLNKSASQLKAYWSKLLFTGKGTPPRVIGNDADMIKLIAANPNMIGYVDAANVTGDVKLVTTF